MTKKNAAGGLILVAAGLITGVWAFAAGNGEVAVPYPDGYRAWPLLHGTLIGPKSPSFKTPCEKPCTGGIFYFYANEKALAGLRTGKFADGSIIADEVLETWGNENGNAKEGARRGVGVMVKDATRYSATGGWGYGSFPGDSKIEVTTAEEKTACFACHVAKKDHDYVFTEYRER